MATLLTPCRMPQIIPVVLEAKGGPTGTRWVYLINWRVSVGSPEANYPPQRKHSIAEESSTETLKKRTPVYFLPKTNKKQTRKTHPKK